MKEIIVSSREDGMRLDKYLQRYLSNAEKNFIYKMLRKKNIKLNDKKCDGSEKIRVNDSIKIYFADETLEKFIGESQVKLKPSIHRVKLDIVYEDKDILVVDKPVGMLSQKASARDVSLVEYVTDYLISNNSLTEEDLKTFHPGVCNRLDRNTSGIVVAGKTQSGLKEMSKAFKERTIHKYYISIVTGVVSDKCNQRAWLFKDEIKNQVKIFKDEEQALKLGLKKEKLNEIITEYMPISCNGKYTLLKINLVTGKSHQIRAHLAWLGHPIIGDLKYGKTYVNEWAKKNYDINRQLLHAYELNFPERNLNVRTKIPNDFFRLMKGERLWEPGTQEVLEAQH